MSRSPLLRLDIWKGDWGLPSIDLDCLRLMTYAKLAGLDLDIRKTNNPFRSPNGALPVFYIGSKTIKTYEELSEYVKSKNICPDYGLTAKQKAEAFAYTIMLKECLYPALQYVWWVDERNHNSLTRPWYCKALPFPLNFYYPNKYHDKAVSLMEALYEGIDEKAQIELKVYSEAEKCLTALSTRLGESRFLFGDHPSSIDATIYAFLAPLLKAPFPNSTLQNHLKACTNLYKYIIRITQRYYLKDSQEYEAKVHEESQRNAQNTNTDVDFPNKLRNQVLAGIFAVTAMSFYALSSGIVQSNPIKYEDDDINENSEYDDPIG